MHNSLKSNGWWLSKIDIGNLDCLIEISRRLGTPVGGRKKGALVEVLKLQDSISANQNSLSNQFGYSPFPFHCDTAHWVSPCRYIVFGCENPGNCGRKTVLIDWKKIEFDLTEIKLLKSAVFLIRNGQKSFYSTILNQNEEFLRFDPGCMSPLDSESEDAFKLMKNKLDQVNPIEVSWEKGDVLVIDNWRILHGRKGAEIEGEHHTARQLQRVLVA